MQAIWYTGFQITLIFGGCCFVTYMAMVLLGGLFGIIATSLRIWNYVEANALGGFIALVIALPYLVGIASGLMMPSILKLNRPNSN
jgi:hypothetical protein